MTNTKYVLPDHVRQALWEKYHKAVHPADKRVAEMVQNKVVLTKEDYDYAMGYYNMPCTVELNPQKYVVLPTDRINALPVRMQQQMYDICQAVAEQRAGKPAKKYYVVDASSDIGQEVRDLLVGSINKAK